MIIDCERCEVRGLACGNCAVPAIVAPSVASHQNIAPVMGSRFQPFS